MKKYNNLLALVIGVAVFAGILSPQLQNKKMVQSMRFELTPTHVNNSHTVAETGRPAPDPATMHEKSFLHFRGLISHFHPLPTTYNAILSLFREFIKGFLEILKSLA